MALFFYFQELEVTDDTVLEEHTEDPATLHIRLLGHGGEYGKTKVCFPKEAKKPDW